jgi:hypothetical protein
LKDKYFNCIQCEKQFILTVAEQAKLFSRGFGLPRRCPDCRRHKSKIVSGGEDEWRNKGRRGHLRNKIKLWEEEM